MRMTLGRPSTRRATNATTSARRSVGELREVEREQAIGERADEGSRTGPNA